MAREIYVIDPECDQILSRAPKIDEKNFEEIVGLMDASFLERNPLIVQRLSSLRIFKAKEESVSNCMRRIHDSYLSAQLDNAPVKTRALLHLITLLPSDPLSEGHDRGRGGERPCKEGVQLQRTHSWAQQEKKREALQVPRF